MCVGTRRSGSVERTYLLFLESIAYRLVAFILVFPIDEYCAAFVTYRNAHRDACLLQVKRSHHILDWEIGLDRLQV